MSSWNSRSIPTPSQPPIPEGIIPAGPTFDLALKKKSPSGLTYTWRLWRHCCCRYGWYPIIIAPIVTAGCLLSLYSAFGCDFVRVNIGFTPTNNEWNQSTAAIGLFLYQSGQPETDLYREALVEGCRSYQSSFTESFIDNDRTWKVARIMAYISGIASMVGTVTAWLFVVSPLPASFFWPGLLLPSLMAAFLAEGSKFLLFDVSPCKNAVWYPSGSDSQPLLAEECTLGKTSYYCIASGATFFLSVLIVCLKAPQKRILDSDFGTRPDFDQGETQESAHNLVHGMDSFGDRDLYSEDPGYDISRTGSSMPDDRSEFQFSQSADSRQISRGSRDYRIDLENPPDCADSTSSRFSEDYKSHESKAAERTMKSLNALDRDRYTARVDEASVDSSNDPRYNPKKPFSKPSSGKQDSGQPVSESRLHTAERLRLNSAAEPSDMIERFVNEVNHSFAKDEKLVIQGVHDEEKKDDHEESRNTTHERSIPEAHSMPQENSLDYPSLLGEPLSARSY